MSELIAELQRCLTTAYPPEFSYLTNRIILPQCPAVILVWSSGVQRLYLLTRNEKKPWTCKGAFAERESR